MNVLQLHKQAILDLLAGGVSPPPAPLDGVVPQGQVKPYLLLRWRMWTPSSGVVPESVSLENTSDVIRTTVYCYSVGDTHDSALVVAGKVRARLLGVTPVVAGRVCAPVLHDDSAPRDPDETTGAAVFNLVDLYEFTSLPG